MRSKEQQRSDLRLEVEDLQSKIQDAQTKNDQDVRRLTEVMERRVERWQRDIAIKEAQLLQLVERPGAPHVPEDGEKSCDLCGIGDPPSITQIYHGETQDWILVCTGCYRQVIGRDTPSLFRGERIFVRVSGKWVQSN